MGISDQESLYILARALARSPYKVAICDLPMDEMLWAGGGWEDITKPEYLGKRWLEFLHPKDVEICEQWRKNPLKKVLRARWMLPLGWTWVAMSKRRFGPFWVVISQVGPAAPDLKLCWECLQMVDGEPRCSDSTVYCPYRTARA